MAKVLEIKNNEGELIGYAVRCPACEADEQGSMHVFYRKMADGKPGWTFNGDFEKPTLKPSMSAVSIFGYGNDQYVEHRCHCFVTDGKIQYLADCTHAMAGQTIDLPDFEEK